MSSVHYLEAALKKGDTEISVNMKRLYVAGRQRPVFPVSIWSEPQTDYISKRILERYNSLNINARYVNKALLYYPGLAEIIAEKNLFAQPIYPQYWDRTAGIEETEAGPVHKNCLHNPELVRERAEMATKTAKYWSRYDVLVYGDGSDRSLGGNCFCEYTLSRFREWLSVRYDNIRQMNGLWGTNFDRRDEIMPDTLAKAREKGRFASWLEHTRFMETSYVQDMVLMRDALRQADPDALMGPDGYGRLNSTDGADWWNILSRVDYYNLYNYQDPPQLEITRSLARYFPNVKYRTIYWGSYMQHFINEPFMKYFPWYSLLHDYNGAYWWTADGKTSHGGSNSGIIAPDLRMTYPFYLSQQGILKIKDGIFHIIDGANRYNSGIAVHYGKTAVYAADAYRSTVHYTNSCTGFENLLEDMGYQYDYVASEQVEAGILENFRVLILPFTLALSEKEASEIEKFVREGGILIAGEKPAQYDYYLRPAHGGSLLAGILSHPGEIFNADSGITLILENPVTAYPRQRQTDQGKEFRNALYGLLNGNGITPITRIIQFPQQTGLPLVEVIRHDKGDIKILSFINYRNAEVTFDFSLDKPAHIYELVTRKNLGKRQTVPVTLDNGEARIYALLDTQITGLQLVSSPEATRGKDFLFEVKRVTEETGNLPAIFRYRVIDPRGKQHPLYCGVVSGGLNGAAVGTIPFALNDITGKWLLEITDMISDRTVVREMLLK
jgi:hypothetical protein